MRNGDYRKRHTIWLCTNKDVTQWDSQGVVCSPEYYFLWGELSSCHSCALKSDELSNEYDIEKEKWVIFRMDDIQKL